MDLYGLSGAESHIQIQFMKKEDDRISDLKNTFSSPSLLPSKGGGEGVEVEKIKNQKSKIKNIKGVAREFESLFIYQLLKAMRSTVPEGDGIFGKGRAEKFYTSMWDEEVSKELAEAGGIGLHSIIMRGLGL